MSDPAVDEIMRGIGANVTASLEQAGRDAVEQTRQLLAVPVGRSASGEVTVRSKAGESPRKESGDLSKSIQYLIDENPRDVYVLSVFSELAYAGLDHGINGIAPRPYLSVIETRFAPLLPQRLSSQINSQPSKS